MRFWIATAVVLSLFALGLAMLPRTIDWNAYRSDIEAAAAGLSGHEVVIEGPIEIALLPSPLLIAKDVTMRGQATETTDFELVAGQAEVAMEVGPLLAGRPVIHDLRLKRPVITFDDKGGRRLLSWPPRWRDWAALFLKLDLKGISIADGTIELPGDRPDRRIGLSDVSLEVRVDGKGGPIEAAGLFKTKRHRFAMEAAFGRPDRDGVSASKVTVEARNGDDETTILRFNGVMRPQGDDRGLRGKISLNGPDLQRGLAAISAATGYPATFRSFASSQPFAVDGRIEADRAGIRTDELQVRLSEKLGKGRLDLQLYPQHRLDLNVELPTLRVADTTGLADFLPLDLLSKLRVPPGRVDIRLRQMIYRGEAARKASLMLETGLDRVTTVKQAKVQLPGLVDVRFEGGFFPGDAGPSLKGKLAAVGDDLRRCLEWLDLVDVGGDDSRGWRSLSLESDVDMTSVEIALSAIDMRLDSSRLSGRASMRFSERLRLALDADVDRLNLDLYAADVGLNAGAEKLADRFAGIDAEIDVRFKRLTWQTVQVESGSIAASAEEGLLKLDRIAATTVGGTALAVEGDIDLDKRAADLSTTLSSRFPMRVLRHMKIDLPSSSARLQPIELAGRVKGMFDRFELDVETDYDGGDATIEGQAGWVDGQPWYDLSIDAAHPDHQALANQFGLAPLLPAGDASGPLEIEGRLRRDRTMPWVTSGNAKLGPTTFTGRLTRRPGTPAAPWEAKLSVGTPRRDSLAPFLILAGLRIAGDLKPGRWLGRLPTTGLRTAWLEDVEGSLSLASKGGLVGDGLKLDARLTDGLLHVERLEASPWGGDLQAEISLERRRDQPVAALAVDLKAIEAAELAAWLGVKSGIEGPLDLHLKASSVGSSAYEIVSGLSGEMSISVGPGKLEGLGIPELQRTLIGQGGAEASSERSLSMPFSGLDAKAGLSRGILTFEDGRLVVGTAAEEGIETTIEGTVDLLLWIADLTLATRSIDEAPASDEPSSLYRVVGPPDRPDGYVPSGN